MSLTKDEPAAFCFLLLTICQKNPLTVRIAQRFVPQRSDVLQIPKNFPVAKWVVLKFKPSVLWGLDCGFCFKDAWSDAKVG
jgi:hypothetical protein